MGVIVCLIIGTAAEFLVGILAGSAGKEEKQKENQYGTFDK